MTLHATRDGQNITIHGNTGVNVLIENSRLTRTEITENAQHVEYFCEQLTRLLNEAQAERNVK